MAEELIEGLGLAPHPEGGWYRETYRSETQHGTRAAVSAVYYVMEAGQRSHWNRVDADEIWLWHAGDPIDLRIATSESGPIGTVRLGSRIGDGEQPQVIVPAGSWQAAEPVPESPAGYTFLSCIVAPAFDFGSYELAPPDWLPGLTGE